MKRGEKPYTKVFKRLETDGEFARRVTGSPALVGGKELDDFMWTRFKAQRRIVEDTSTAGS